MDTLLFNAIFAHFDYVRVAWVVVLQWLLLGSESTVADDSIG
ncbi:hypothetical protein DSM3645_29222 [Blastopirellula marina DSM 3645]|uniref:Uncharacterized protein n=1 Tax=Blastopirellula marina DSM 3645 TaxID=314230 RepID=A3ZPR6_9BACT|nr:hypothetical protein DSM3645_29222 [Blastopirellula marina DSM 3645]